MGNIQEVLSKDLNKLFKQIIGSDIKKVFVQSTTVTDGIKQERSKEINELMQPLLAQYKLESEGKKLYKLETSEVKLEALFGSLTTLDSEIKKVKVSISRLRILD